MAKYNNIYLANKEMHHQNFNENEFIKELVTTHTYRNLRSPAVLGVYEQRIKTFQNQKKVVNNKATILLEMINGETLKNKISYLNSNPESMNNPATKLLYLMLMIDLSLSIEFLHGRNLIHRDIKPDNIIISNNLEVKLIDFGISKFTTNSCTQTAEKGTILYEPPENFDLCDVDLTKTDLGEQKRKISKAFDIWSFGLILSEIFGSEPPWGEVAGSSITIMKKLMNKERYPIPKLVNTEENKKLKLLIESCTETNPDERIKISEVISLLVSIFIDALRETSKNYDISKLFSNNSSSTYINNNKLGNNIYLNF